MTAPCCNSELTTIVGPAPAGFVIQALGVAWAFVDAISFRFIVNRFT